MYPVQMLSSFLSQGFIQENKWSAHSKAQGKEREAFKCPGPAFGSNQWSLLLDDIPQHFTLHNWFFQSHMLFYNVPSVVSKGLH